MMLPPVVRIFFAVDLPVPTKEKLSVFIHRLKEKANQDKIRWTKVENLHITLQFLARVETKDLPVMIKKTREALRKNHSGLFSLGSLQLFPNENHPHVIAMEVLEQDELAKLSADIGEGIRSAGYEIENRPFHAHLTLGRMKQRQERVNVDVILNEGVPVFDPIFVQEVILFRSEPQAAGSKYTPLDRFKLS
jgi:2'-5' RNA ligase